MQESRIFDRKITFRMEDLSFPTDFQHLFPKRQPLVLDIGAGQGEFAKNMAVLYPQWNFLCLEKRLHRIRCIESKVRNHHLDNVCALYGHIEWFIPHCFFDQSIFRAYMNFPDPWLKHKYANKRNMKWDFLDDLYRILQKGAEFHFATDIVDYAEHAFEILDAHPGFINDLSKGQKWRIEVEDFHKTLFYYHAMKDGRQGCFLRFQKI